MTNSSIWPIGRTLSSGPGSSGNEAVLDIPPSSSTEASTSDCFVSLQDIRWLRGFYTSAEMQSVYSKVLANRTSHIQIIKRVTPKKNGLTIEWSYLIKLWGGARGVMVIVVGNGHGDTSSNPGRFWLHFT